MHNKSFLNKLSFVLVAILYLSFYLFSPLFHHHDENSVLEEGKGDYHSHLIQDVTEQTNRTECHHQLDQNDEHNHPTVFNVLVTNLPPRSVGIVNNILLVSNIIPIEFKTETRKINYASDFHVGKTLKDKCVHFASNVSPPIILAA
ncbi:MAG: hypothetical protein Q8T08_25160 [Ignavibacteria bacterium]|nr:hypothetical protein [Ignavibacteria bacterium]